MLFGWDTGLIGGVLTMDAFQHSFGLDPKSSSFANLQGNIVSVLQAGCFFGAMSSFYLSDKLQVTNLPIVSYILTGHTEAARKLSSSPTSSSYSARLSRLSAPSTLPV